MSDELTHILEVVTRFYNVTGKELISHRRHMHLVWARQVAMYLMRQRTDRSFGTIGEFMHRDHTTVIYAHQTVPRTCHGDDSRRAEVDEIISRINATQDEYHRLRRWGKCYPHAVATSG